MPTTMNNPDQAKEQNEDSKKYHHVIKELHRPWAILPNTFKTICEIVNRRISGGKQASEEVEIKASPRERQVVEPYMEGQIKVIPVYGIIAKRMNLFIQFSGGVSTEILIRDIGLALSDPMVKGILLDIDSPGGSVDGPFEVSNFIFENRGQKPIVAFANGMMASAAYLIGSAADYIVSSQAAMNGSIGVVTVHHDFSKFDEQVGVKRTVLYSGKYKAVGHDAAPLSAQDRKIIQSELDFYYSMFVDAVAQNREMSTQATLKMAEGRIFIGQQGLNVGLIDEIGTYESSLQTVVSLLTDSGKKKSKGGRKMQKDEMIKQLTDEMSMEELIEAFPQVFDAGLEAGEKRHSEAIEKERSRVLEIMDADADEKLTRKAIEDGTDASEFYKAAWKAHQEKEKEIQAQRQENLKELGKETPVTIGAEIPEEPDSTKMEQADAELTKRANELSEKEGITVNQAMSRILREDKDLAERYYNTYEVGTA